MYLKGLYLGPEHEEALLCFDENRFCFYLKSFSILDY